MQYQAILCDIEGTISPISFVKDVLFPYAAKHLESFLLRKQGQSPLAECLQSLWQSQPELNQDIDKTIETLRSWIDADIKETHLKTIQGMIWRSGYESGELVAPLYEDAYSHLLGWYEQNIPLYIYSSGSIQAQKLFFSYSSKGNISHLFSGFFDTTSGDKKTSIAYQNIVDQIRKDGIELEPQTLLFLTDIEAELVAAQSAGLDVGWLRRDLSAKEYANAVQMHPSIHLSFETIEV